MQKFAAIRLLACLLALPMVAVHAQNNKVLFDASSAQMAGNADWVLDADLWNIGFPAPGLPVVGAGNEANPARFSTPAQSGITASTGEQYWKGGLSSFGVSLAKLGYSLETLSWNGSITFGNSANPQDLSNYKVFVVCEPNLLFAAAEKTAIVQWVQAGGGLLMIGNHNGSDRNNDGQDAPAIWNDLMASNSVAVNPFGITFDLQSFSQTSTNRANLPANKILNGTQGNVTSLQYSAGTSMTLDPTKNASVKGLFWKTGVPKNNFNVMLAQANYGAGRVVALGDSSPADDGTGDPNDALYNGFTGQVSGNHKKMLLNAVIWLAGNAGPLPPPGTERGAFWASVYPNPAREAIYVSWPENVGEAQLSLFDCTGRLLRQIKVDGDASPPRIGLEGLPTGLFFVEIATDSGHELHRFLKN